MRTMLWIAACLTMLACKQNKQEKSTMAQTESEEIMKQEKEWTMLFDGNSFENWHYYNGGEIDGPWAIEDGAMVFYPPENREKGQSYNIVTDDDYTNFMLSLEWKVAEGGNSGIFWGVHEDEKFGQPYQTGPEIQVLDDERHPDAKNGTTHQAGALYDMVAPSKKVVKPAGEWNLCEITINHNSNEGMVKLNGEQIVEFPVHGELWDEMVAKSKFADWEGFGVYKTGKIGLQDHGDKVAFRNIKIKEL